MAESQSRLLEQLRKKLESLEGIPEEPRFHRDEALLKRFLIASENSVETAAEMVIATIEWRKNRKPWQQECQWCLSHPGFHSMRQVGFDLLGRPVIYSCFAQASTQRGNTAEDCVDHVVYLLESAMAMGASSWVFVIDCTGMNTNSCHPKLGKAVTRILSDYYPETLGLAICVNHNVVFQGVYKAAKVFLNPATVSKVALVTDKRKRIELFCKHFPPELVEWLLREMKLNKQQPLPVSQAKFWLPPEDPDSHDPRGCPSYVNEHILPLSHSTTTTQDGAVSRLSKAHPNILQYYNPPSGNDVKLSAKLQNNTTS